MGIVPVWWGWGVTPVWWGVGRSEHPARALGGGAMWGGGALRLCDGESGAMGIVPVWWGWGVAPVW
jgi:hypothetical protein